MILEVKWNGNKCNREGESIIEGEDGGTPR
jgi:hypothetical protein